MAFTEDFTAFLDTDGFAVTASYTPASTGVPVSIDIIFDGEYSDPLTHETINPQCLGKLSDFSSVADDDDITIESIAYKIRTPKPDGTGMITCMLEVV